MKKTLFLITLLTISLGLFAQSSSSHLNESTSPKSYQKADLNPTVAITFGTITTSSAEVIFTPDANCGSYIVLIGNAALMPPVTDSYITFFGLPCTGNYTHVWNQLDPNTEYTVYVLPKDLSGTVFPYQTATCTTLQIGGTGLSTLTIEVSDIATTQARVIVTPNAETSVFHYGLITLSYFNEIGADSAINYFKADPYPLYSVDNWIWPELIPNTTYKVLGIGENANNEWGTSTIVEFTTLSETGISADEKESAHLAVISPNPSNGKFKIELKSLDAIEIEIYDMTGSIVLKQSMNNSNNYVNAEFLANGIYTIKFLTERKIIGIQKFIKSSQ